jgi:serine/threonine-protein kinase HipA
LAYSYKPGSAWVNHHWMRLNGKQDNFTREDFYSFEKLSPIFNKRKINDIIEETTEHVSRWNELATEQSVPHALLKLVGSNLRLTL